MDHHSGDPTDAALSGDVAVFSQYLRETGTDFLVLGDTGNADARVRFTGRFQGVEVVWDCHFTALRQQRQVPGNRHGAVTGQPLRNFIEIGPRGATGIPINVGLDLECVDGPAILKMIMMIRNYKRLKVGRHEFGEPLSG